MSKPEFILISCFDMTEAYITPCGTVSDEEDVGAALIGVDHEYVDWVYRIFPDQEKVLDVTDMAAELWFYEFSNIADCMAIEDDIPDAYRDHIDLNSLNNYICAHSENAAAERNAARAATKGDYVADCAREGG